MALSSYQTFLPKRVKAEPVDDVPAVPKRKALRVREEVQGQDVEEVEETDGQQQPTGVALSKRALRVLNSKFGEKSQVIVDQLEFGISDGVTSLITRSLLQTLVDVLPITEKNLRKNEGTKGVYQFNQVISQIRELLADIQAAQDRGMLGHSIVEKSVRPAFLDISVQIVMAMTEIESFGKANLDGDQQKELRSLTENLKRNLASYIMTQYRDVSDNVIQSLS